MPIPLSHIKDFLAFARFKRTWLEATNSPEAPLWGQTIKTLEKASSHKVAAPHPYEIARCGVCDNMSPTLVFCSNVYACPDCLRKIDMGS